MIDLSKYIYELLHSHECVAVPGLGGFIIRKKNAVLYMAQNLFAPPSKHLHFNAQLTHNDGLLAHHISKKTGTSYEKALENINEAVSDILYQLYKGKSVIFNDLGTISNLNGFLKFEPASEQNIQDDNYGLNSFIMHTLQPDRRRNRQIITHKERKISQRKPIRSYQIAAVIAFLLLSIGGYFLQTEPVQDYMKSSLYPQISFLHCEGDVIASKAKQPKQSSDNQCPGLLRSARNDENTEFPHNLEGGGVEDEVAALSSEEIIDASPLPYPAITHVSEDSFMQTPVFGQYYIIIGAFQHPELAENLCKRMKENGYPAAAILDIPSSSLRRVALQSFDNLASAQESLREVKQMQEDAWVLKWKN